MTRLLRNQTVIFTITDDCSNSSDTAATFTIEDTTARFWLQTLDKDGFIIPDLSMEDSAPANAETIDGGNIVVPH